MPTITVSPLGKSTLASAHAFVSRPVLPGAPKPHSANCQTTPASCPMTSLSHATKGRFGNFASRLEAETCWAADIACFSNDSDWVAALNHTHNAMMGIFIFIFAQASIFRAQVWLRSKKLRSQEAAPPFGNPYTAVML